MFGPLVAKVSRSRSAHPRGSAWSRDLLLGLVALALVGFAAAPARADWQQPEFYVGVPTWSGFANWQADPADTLRMGRLYRLAADANINLLGLQSRDDLVFELRTATALGIKVLVPALNSELDDWDAHVNTVSRPAGVTNAEWASFLGYSLDPKWGSYGDHIPSPTSDARSLVHQYHVPDSSKVVAALEIGINDRQAWMQDPLYPDPMDHPDVWLDEHYVPRNYSDNLCTLCGGPNHWYMSDFWPPGQPYPLMTFALVNGNGYGYHVDPYEPALRAMAFLPVAYGARGVVWSEWAAADDWVNETWDGFTTLAHEPHISGTRHGFIPTVQFRRLARINGYLRSVVGPAIMKCDHLQTLFSRAAQEGDPEPYLGLASYSPFTPDPAHLPGPGKLVVQESDLPFKIGLSVWQPRTSSAADPAGTYYLLIFNTLLSGNSGFVSLHGATSYAVGESPSVVGYLGGNSYRQITPNYSQSGEDHVTQLFVSLAGGEGRIYKIVPAASQSDFAGLLSPGAGESWAAGSIQTISWSGIQSDARVRLYLDCTRPGPPSGPYVDLATGVSGTSCNATIPNVSASRARIEVSGYTASGAYAQVLQQTPSAIAGASSQAGVTGYQVASSRGTAFASLAVDPLGRAQMLFTNDLPETTFRARVWDSYSHAVATIPDRTSQTNSIPGPLGQFGLSPALASDASGNLHAAYFPLFADVVGQQGETGVCLHYMKRTGSTWGTPERVAVVNLLSEGCAIALDADGQPFVGYNSGGDGNYRLHVAHRAANGTWSDLGIGGTLKARDPSILVDGDGSAWVGSVSPYGHYTVYVGSQEVGSFTSIFDFAGVSGDATMQWAPDGVLEFFYVSRDPATGSDRLLYRRMDWEWTTPSVVIDASLKQIRGLGAGYDASTCCVAYSCNGVLREALRGTSGAWTIHDVVRQSDIERLLAYAITPAGTRWFSYWDKAGETIWAASYTPGTPEPPPGDDPGVILHALKLESPNPLLVKGDLVFSLKAAAEARLDLDLLDVQGRVVSNRHRIPIRAGENRVVWHPDGVRPGIYFVRVRCGEEIGVVRRIAFLQ